MRRVYAVCKVSAGVLNMVSAGFLMVGIYSIRKLVEESSLTHQHISVPQLLLHFGTLFLYMASTVYSFYEYIKYIWGGADNANVNAYLLSIIICNYLSMVSLLLMAVILYPIT